MLNEHCFPTFAHFCLLEKHQPIQIPTERKCKLPNSAKIMFSTPKLNAAPIWMMSASQIHQAPIQLLCPEILAPSSRDTHTDSPFTPCPHPTAPLIVKCALSVLPSTLIASSLNVDTHAFSASISSPELKVFSELGPKLTQAMKIHKTIVHFLGNIRLIRVCKRRD